MKVDSGDEIAMGLQDAEYSRQGFNVTMSNVRKHFLLLAAFSLVISCGTNNKDYQISRNLEQPKESQTPEQGTAEQSTSTLSTKIETLADFEKCEFYRDYRLHGEDGYKLNTGAYNNTYETSSLPDIAIEVQTINDRVIGFGIIFYERDSLHDAELNFVYKLLQSIDTTVRLDSRVEEYIKTNAERNVFQVKQATPITFAKFKVYAGKVGADQTISIEKV